MIPIEPLNSEGRARHRCEGCGLVTAPILPTSKVHCRCRPPGVIQSAVNFSQASIIHLVSGADTVADDVRNQRLSVCESCEKFDGKVCTHPKCGCSIKKKRAFIDKLSWASSVCPIGKW